MRSHGSGRFAFGLFATSHPFGRGEVSQTVFCSKHLMRCGELTPMLGRQPWVALREIRRLVAAVTADEAPRQDQTLYSRSPVILTRTPVFPGFANPANRSQ